MGQGCRRHRHADHGRSLRVNQRDERGLHRVDGQGRRSPCRRKGFDHRSGSRQREENLLRRRRRQDDDQARPEDAGDVFNTVETIKRQLRTLETLGKPVVAAINGAALGGGLEIALACHHRIAADVKGSQLGLPEVTLGLLPGGGGVTRTVRMFGIQNAFVSVLAQGTRFKPAKAKEIGLVDELVATVEELVPAAKAWIKEELKANPDGAGVQPWDKKGYKMPGGTPSSPGLAAILPSFPSNLRKQLKVPRCRRRGPSWPPRSRGHRSISTPPAASSRYFASLVTGQVAKNMMQAFFFDLQAINAGGSRRRHRQDPDQEDRCAGCGHDGRRHRLRLCQGRL